jgi:hypothetical protein
MTWIFALLSRPGGVLPSHGYAFFRVTPPDWTLGLRLRPRIRQMTDWDLLLGAIGLKLWI